MRCDRTTHRGEQCKRAAAWELDVPHPYATLLGETATLHRCWQHIKPLGRFSPRPLSK